MSTKSKAVAEAESVPSPAGGKRKGGKRTLLLAAVGLLAGAGAGGAFWHFRMQDAGEPKPAAQKPPQFINMELFTVNLKAEPGDDGRYLQVGLVFQTAGSESADAMKQHMPVIRSRILLLLSARTGAELAAVEGKNRLAKELLEAARGPIPEALRPGVAAVHFSAFVIQ